MMRAKRIKQPFILAFVDVDGLKATNDSLGHAAGDQLLHGVAETLRAYLRSYDLVIRFGGDEFICALMDLSFEEADKRFALIDKNLSATHHGSITVGLAMLEQDDSLEELIARADEALYEKRSRRSSTQA